MFFSYKVLNLGICAQALATRGWLVLPCAPDGKRPALRGNWQDLATTSPAQIRAWWTLEPFNIGIACGPSGLIVIDLDMPTGQQPSGQAASGASQLAALCRRYREPYPMPTYAADTPSGGRHLHYAAPAARVRNSAGRLGPLIDVRGAAGTSSAPAAASALDECAKRDITGGRALLGLR